METGMNVSIDCRSLARFRVCMNQSLQSVFSTTCGSLITSTQPFLSDKNEYFLCEVNFDMLGRERGCSKLGHPYKSSSFALYL